MKSLLVPTAGVLVLMGTLGGGWLQSKTATRWGGDALMNAAATKLTRPLGERVHNWRLVSDAPLAPDVVSALQCPAHINRTYVNEQTGDMVSVFVIIGPPGPVAVHTPEICGVGQDFALADQRTAVTIRDRSEHEHTLWQVALRPRDATRESLRVLYGWGTGGKWSATNDPRFVHASAPYLYKIQLSGPETNGTGQFDPCRDFLTWFLPELEARLVAPATSVSSPAPNS